MDRKAIQRFQKFIELDIISGCWVWIGYTDRGYAQFSFNGHMRWAHRLSYEHWNGEIPKGLTIDHLCRNKSCVNPTHLEAVTHQVNILRGTGMSAIHAKKTHCPQGHAYDKANTYRYRNSRYCKACFKLKNKEVKHNYTS